MGISLIATLGLVHVMKCKGSITLDGIPVDICANAMIVSSWKIWSDKLLGKNDDLYIYNATSVRNITLSSIPEAHDVLEEYPSMKQFGTTHMTFSTCPYYVLILRIFRNILPSLIADALMCISGNEPR